MPWHREERRAERGPRGPVAPLTTAERRPPPKQGTRRRDKSAWTMRHIAKPGRHTGLLPVRQRCGTWHSKQDSTQMQKGYTLSTRMGLGPARRFTADITQPNPGSPRRGGCCCLIRTGGSIDVRPRWHAPLVSWPAKAGHPRLCRVQQGKVVGGRPPPAMTRGAVGAIRLRVSLSGA